MTQDELNKLEPGLYEITWEGSKQTDLAAIGRNFKGQLWVAPCSWTEFTVPICNPALWKMIKSVKLIQMQHYKQKPIKGVKKPPKLRGL